MYVLPIWESLSLVHDYLYTPIPIYTSIYTYEYLYTQVPIYTSTYIHKYLCTQVPIYTSTYTYIHNYLYTRLPIYMITYIHNYLYTRLLIYTITYIHQRTLQVGEPSLFSSLTGLDSVVLLHTNNNTFSCLLESNLVKLETIHPYNYASPYEISE